MKSMINVIGTKGWRPILTVILLVALIMNFIIIPILAGFGIIIPALRINELISALATLAGLAGLRTLEKINEVDTKEIVKDGTNK